MISLRRIAESNSVLERVAEEVVRWKVMMPRMVDLESSRVCNLKCPGCPRNSESSLCHTGDRYVTLEKVGNLLEQIPTLATFNFMGDGEPLCNPEFNDIIHLIGSKGINTIVTTNGTLLTKEIIEGWKRDKVYRVHVSIDGATKETYERERVGAVFEKTLENLKLLCESGISVCVNMMLYEDTIKEMPGMVRVCKEAGAKEVTFLMPICALGSDNDGSLQRPERSLRNYELFQEAGKLCKELGVKWIFPIDLNPMFRRLSFPFTRPQVTLDGNVYSCCYMIGRGKTWFDGHLVDIPSEDYILGNAFKQDFREIWYSDAMNELRDTVKRTERKRGTVITREELKEMREHIGKGRFAYCEACLPRWGMACS